MFVVLSPWAGSRSRLVLALGLRRAVAPRKGNCWVRIDLAILGLLAQAIVFEIRTQVWISIATKVLQKNWTPGQSKFAQLRPEIDISGVSSK